MIFAFAYYRQQKMKKSKKKKEIVKSLDNRFHNLKFQTMHSPFRQQAQ